MWPQANQQTDIHTLPQCCHASVGLAQARPNYAVGFRLACGGWCVPGFSLSDALTSAATAVVGLLKGNGASNSSPSSSTLSPGKGSRVFTSQELWVPWSLRNRKSLRWTASGNSRIKQDYTPRQIFHTFHLYYVSTVLHPAIAVICCDTSKCWKYQFFNLWFWKHWNYWIVSSQVALNFEKHCSIGM